MFIDQCDQLWWWVSMKDEAKVFDDNLKHNNPTIIIVNNQFIHASISLRKTSKDTGTSLSFSVLGLSLNTPHGNGVILGDRLIYFIFLTRPKVGFVRL